MKIKTNNSTRSGFTLVEVLVVIAIMSILVALTIPQLRVISKERGIRESARVVGSLFATASQRAVADGTSGVVIVRNNNMVDDVNGFRDAATTMYRLRAIPDYSGNQLGDGVQDAVDRTTAMPTRVPHKIAVPVPLFNVTIRPGDYIFIGDRNTGYRITTVEDGATEGNDTGKLWLKIKWRGNSIVSPLPFPRFVAGAVPFRIQLRPAVVQSSRVDMPAGYRVSLNYSGIGAISTFVGANAGPFDLSNQENIAIVFNKSGAIDYYQVGNGLPVMPVSDLHLLVTEDGLELDVNEDVLVKDDNLWVNVNKGSGSTSVTSSLGQPNDGTPLLQRLTRSRQIARTRQSATQ